MSAGARASEDGGAHADAAASAPASPEPTSPKALLARLGLGAAEMEAEGRLLRSGTVRFAFDRAELRAESEPVLDPIARLLQEHPAITRLRVEAHTDNVGSDERNLTLSAERALAVARYLARHGVACERLVAVGFGPLLPIISETRPSRDVNRRIEFVVLGVDGAALGPDGAPPGRIAGDPCEATPAPNGA